MGDMKADACGMCGRKKLIVGYVDSLGQRTRLPLTDKVLTVKDKHGTVKVRLAGAFKEPYPEGHRASLLACSNCDEVEWWPRSRKKLRKTSR